MAGFYIKKVIAKSDTKPTSFVEFTEGLSIIQGRSDTGKSCIVKCIEFVFGGDMKHLKTPFKESSGFNEAVVVLSTDEGDITISRKVGKNSVEVSAPDIDWIEGGIYALKKPPKTAKNPKPVLNEIMMQLLGFDEEPEVTKNARFDKERMTWASLLRLVYIKEGRIDSEEAIFEPTDNYEKTPFLSSLLYLLYGHDFGNADAQTKKEIKKARREAIKEYLSGKIQIASDRREQLKKQMQLFVGVNVEQAITDMVSSLNATEQSISAALDKSKSLLGEIMKGEKRLAQCNVLLSRYEYLRSQYKADIQRLSFIVEGEQETKKLPTVSTCPFCEGKIVHRKKATYVDASKAELTRIIAQLEGLDTAEKNVQLEKEEIEALLEKLRQERDDIDRLIKDELKPKSAELEASINALKAYVRLSEEMRVVAAYAQDWETDIDNYDATEETETPLVYHPKDYFDSEFQTGMTENAESILTECRYHNFTAARFDIPTFDIEVNGESKSSSHGKGYRSYLNTVVALMFRKFFMEHAVYNPGLLIIDTPLHGLDEEVSEDAPESMRAGLFTYFMNHQEGQLIIIENLDHIPNLDYVSSGANVITFTKRRGDGSRYGFLNEVY